MIGNVVLYFRSFQTNNILYIPKCFFQTFIAYSSGRVIERECIEGEKLLVKSIGLKHYKAAAAAVTKIQPLMKKTIEQIGQKLKVELRNYSRDPTAVFKYDGDVEKLANYRSEHSITDAEQKLPILHTLICKSFSNVSEEKFAVNKKALAISGVLIPWIPSNKFTHRNNVILTTGGCKSEEIDYFHGLGLSSHKNTLRNIQERLSKNHDEDVKKWKESAMFDIKKMSLFKEVLSRQDQVNRANVPEDHGDRSGKPFSMTFLLIFAKKLEKSNHGNFRYFCLKIVNSRRHRSPSCDDMSNRPFAIIGGPIQCVVSCRDQCAHKHTK